MEFAERIDRLEAQCLHPRWVNRVISALVLAGVVLVFLGAHVRDVPKVIEAEQFLVFLVRDGNGLARASLRTADDGTVSQDFFGRSGKTRMSVHLNRDECPSITLFRKERKGSVGLELKPDGSIVQVFTDEEGLPRFQSGVDANDSPILRVMDRQGTQRFGASQSPDGSTSVFLSDQEAVRLALTTNDKDGRAQLLLNDQQGKARFLAMAQSNGPSGLALLDRTGNRRVSLESTQDGKGKLAFLGDDRKERIHLGLTEDNGAIHEICDQHGKNALRLLSRPEGAALILYDEGKNPRVALSKEEKGGGRLMILSAEGNPRFGVMAPTVGQTELRVYDDRGNVVFLAPQ